MESLIKTSIYRSRLLDSVEKVVNCYKDNISCDTWHNFETNISVIRCTTSHYLLYIGMINLEFDILPLLGLTTLDYNAIISCFDNIISNLDRDEHGKHNTK